MKTRFVAANNHYAGKGRSMAKEGWPKITSSTLSDQVYQAVRDRILEGELEPGDFAREQEISDAMGVSRTPVREALGRLASEGFLERIRHRGFRVPEDSVDQLLELYPIVSALELLAGRLAFPRVEHEDLAELRRINEELKQALAGEAVDEAIELNNRFHAFVSERSGNGRLVDLLNDFRSQLRRLEKWFYSYQEHGERSVNEHDALIDALEAGELDRALAIFERNMRLTTTALLEETERTENGRLTALRDGLLPGEQRAHGGRGSG